MEHPWTVLADTQALVAAARRLGLDLSTPQAERTSAYVELLRDWSRTTSLVQARSAADLLTRHLAEGWAAAALVPRNAAGLLDIGSGGGIPGIPIAIRWPELPMTLVEPKARKAAFLTAVARRCSLVRVTVASVRLSDLPPVPWPVISLRGIDLPAGDVIAHLCEDGSVLRFPGAQDLRRTEWLQQGFMPAEQARLPTAGLVVERWARP